MPMSFVAAWWPGRMLDIKSSNSDWRRLIKGGINNEMLGSVGKNIVCGYIYICRPRAFHRRDDSICRGPRSSSGLDRRSPVGDNRMPGGVEHPCGIQGSIRRLADRTFLGACYSHVTQLLGHRRANGGTNTIHYVHEESFHAGRSSLNRIFWFRTIQSG